MGQPIIDIQLLQYLQDNGFTKQQATVLLDLHREKDSRFQNLADKKDILLIKKDIEHVQLNIEQLRKETKKEIELLRADTKKEIEHVQLSIEQLRADTKKEIELLKYSLLIKLTIIMFALSTLSVTALTLWIKFVLIGLNVG